MVLQSKSNEYFRCFFVKKKKSRTFREICAHNKDTESGLNFWKNDIELNKILLKINIPYLKQVSFAYHPKIGTRHSILEHLKLNNINSKKTFLKLDIKKFFNNLDHKIIRESIKKWAKIAFDKKLINDSEYNMLEKRLEIFLKENANVNGGKGVLQGLISSPMISDIYMRDFDNKMIDALLNDNNNLNYSRYADDLLFSKEINESWDSFIEFVSSALSDVKLVFNVEKKTVYDFYGNSNHARFLGINITNRLNMDGNVYIGTISRSLKEKAKNEKDKNKKRGLDNYISYMSDWLKQQSEPKN